MKSKSLLALLYSCLASIIIWNVGCASVAPSPSPQPATTANGTTSQAVYVVTSNGIAGFAIQPTDGSLTSLNGSPFAPSLHANLLAPSPSGQIILAQVCCGTDDIPRIWALHVDSHGTLQANSAPAFQSSLTAQGSPSLAFSSSGKVVYLSNYEGPVLISAHSFDPGSGSISPTPSSQTQFPISCGDPTLCSQDATIVGDSTVAGSEFLWVRYTTCSFHEDCDGPLQPVPVSSDGTALGASSVGSTNMDGTNMVSGLATLPGGIVTVQQMSCCSVTSIGSYVFQNGKLVGAAGCPVETPACATAWSVAVHPNQKLVIIGTTDNTLLTASRDDAGNLSMPVATNIALPMRADKILFDQSGQHLYVLGASNTIFGFSVDSNSGALKPIAGSPWTTGSYDAATAIIIQLPSGP